MAQKKSYSRYFIILQQDENGYSLASDKLPSGYTKLETKNDKCKISYYVQNLKKDLEPYQMVLICSKKEMRKLVNLGNMTVDEYGRAEISYEYNAANIANTSIPIEMVTGAAVIKHNTNKEMHCVMSGFITNDAPRDWKSFKSIDIEDTNAKAQNKVENQSLKVEKSTSIFDEYEKSIEVNQKIVEDKKTSDETKENIKEDESKSLQEHIDVKENSESNKEIREDSKKEISRESEKSEVLLVDDKNETVEKPKDNQKVIENDDNNDRKNVNNGSDKKTNDIPEVTITKGTLEKFFDDIAKDFTKVDNICEDIKRCDWYRVDIKSLEDMCDASDYNKYTVVYYPMISYYPYIKKHGHFMLGYKHDIFGNIKYLVYGIPGLKSINDQPYAGRSGFVTWAINDENREATNEIGYWLMFYDFRNSTIVIPIQ